MDMNISKTYSETISINYQTWKYTTTLTKTVNVENGEQLKKESDKLFEQVKRLTRLDIDRESKYRQKALEDLQDGTV